MKSILKSSVLSIIIFTFLQPMFSQEAVPFKTQKEFYIYGDATVIGKKLPMQLYIGVQLIVTIKELGEKIVGNFFTKVNV